MRFAVISLFLASLLFGGVAGCASGGSLPNLPTTSVSEYTLDSGDKIQLTVFGETRLDGSYTVNDSGQISVPLVGPVDVRNLNLAGVEKRLASLLLQRELVLNPSVSAQIAEFRPFFILGEVEKPGQYPYVEGMTVLTAVAVAGGFTFRAEKQYVSVTRKVEGASVEYRATRDSQVLPGDTINVFERFI